MKRCPLLIGLNVSALIRWRGDKRMNPYFGSIWSCVCLHTCVSRVATAHRARGDIMKETEPASCKPISNFPPCRCFRAAHVRPRLRQICAFSLLCSYHTDFAGTCFYKVAWGDFLSITLQRLPSEKVCQKPLLLQEVYKLSGFPFTGYLFFKVTWQGPLHIYYKKDLMGFYLRLEYLQSR